MKENNMEYGTNFVLLVAKIEKISQLLNEITKTGKVDIAKATSNRFQEVSEDEVKTIKDMMQTVADLFYDCSKLCRNLDEQTLQLIDLFNESLIQID